MANKELKVKIQEAYDTEGNWRTINPVLLEGQLAFSSDKYGKYKIGDGTSRWNELEYITFEASAITQDTTHRFVTDLEKNNWNNKTAVSIVRWS